jgi:hypothetical protein
MPPLTASGLVANGSIPNVKSFLATANNGFDYEFGGGISLSELTIGISSTELNYTDPGAGGGLDMTIELDTANYDIRGTEVIVGDLITGVNNKQVWASASGPQYLIRADFLCSHGTTTYLQVFAKDSPVNGDKPSFQCAANTDTGSVVQYNSFGTGGISPLSGTNKGCTLAVSTTSGFLTAIVDSSAVIRAIYRPA